MFSSLSINEKQFLLQSLQNNFRTDVRPLDSFRDIDIKYGEENGQVFVKFGNTKVLGGANIALVGPSPGKPNEGFFKFSIDFSSLSQQAESLNFS